MRSIRLFLAGWMVFLAGVCAQAAPVRLGVHGVYSTGGSTESDDFGYGFQLGWHWNDHVSLDLTDSFFDDVDGAVKFNDIAGTLRLGFTVTEGIFLYAGGGLTYLMTTFETGDSPHDELGYHYCAGMELQQSEYVDVFLEYRKSYIDYDDLEDTYEFGLFRLGVSLVFH